MLTTIQIEFIYSLGHALLSLLTTLYFVKHFDFKACFKFKDLNHQLTAFTRMTRAFLGSYLKKIFQR